ncbi:MAG: hypothetical protein WBX22_09945, partial [Silvibacterium sp.]
NKQPEAGGEGSCSMCEAFSRSINSKALTFAKMNGAIVTQLDERCQPESSRIFPLSNATNLRRPAPKWARRPRKVPEKCLSVSSFLRCFVNMED